MGHLSSFIQTMLTFFYHLTSKLGFPNYGVAIIFLTISIKMLLFPFTLKQVKSMQRLRDLNPQIQEIREKYKENKSKQQYKVAMLYRESGVKPFGGCFPLLIQMPFLSGIFYTIKNFNYVSQPHFLWIKNLANTDPFYILPILAAITTYISSQQTIAGSNQNKLILIMPLFIGYMAMRFPAGLGLYWVVSNLFQIAQQWLLFRKPLASQQASS